MVEKNEKKARAKKHRVLIAMNTGTRTMRDKTTYNRQKEKAGARSAERDMAE